MLVVGSFTSFHQTTGTDHYEGHNHEQNNHFRDDLIDAADPGDDVVACPDQRSARNGAGDLSQASQDHDHECINDILGTHAVVDIVQVSKDATGDARKPRGEREGNG